MCNTLSLVRLNGILETKSLNDLFSEREALKITNIYNSVALLFRGVIRDCDKSSQ